MSNYVAPISFQDKDENAVTTKSDVLGILPATIWGQNFGGTGSGITGDMSGVTSIRIPVSAAAGEIRFLIETNDSYALVVRPEADGTIFDPNEEFVIDTAGCIESPQVYTSALTIGADYYTVDNGSYYISPFRPAFFGFPLTGQQTFEFLGGGSSGNAMATTYHYYWVFDTGDTAPTITWPSEITSWYGGSVPTIQANKHYEVSVLGHYISYGSSLVGVIMEV